VTSALPWYETHGIEPGLLLGPPGCGKTEHLARWVHALSQRGDIRAPRRVLALTFSNKAKANLRARLRRELGPRWHRVAFVTNFHGLAYRVYQHHASAIGREPLAIAPQRGWLAAFTTKVVKATGCDRDELAAALRHAKHGPFGDDEVIARLQDAGVEAAAFYEDALRSQERADFDDVIRLGHLTLCLPEVQHLYRASFAAVIVDEVQDLSMGQLQLARYIGAGRTVYAGDIAQGIYSFAGAAPTDVLSSIRSERPAEFELEESYRSSPAVLRVVSAVRQELGGGALVSAVPENWAGRGTTKVLRTRHVSDEATEVVSMAQAWLTGATEASVAVIARTAARRRAIDQHVNALGMPAEVWDFPAHRPLIATLLTRHIDVSKLAGNDEEVLQDLYNRCLADIDPSDLDALDELQEACDAIEELGNEGYSIEAVVAGIRVSSDPDAPVGAGLHLLNGHVGKGQQFDHVIVVGLEEAILPHFAAMLAERKGHLGQITEELAVLHVMVSRAREDLVVTVADVVPKWDCADMDRTPSRFLSIVQSVVDDVIDLR
jgi:DNA helicase-2/ATP-dependent DNA helicase PcrA